MKLKKLFEKLKELRSKRKDYRVKPTIRLCVDDHDYYFAFLPAVLYMPWIYRHPDTDGVIDIWWLNMHLLIGHWNTKKEDSK